MAHLRWLKTSLKTMVESAAEKEQEWFSSILALKNVCCEVYYRGHFDE